MPLLPDGGNWKSAVPSSSTPRQPGTFYAQGNVNPNPGAPPIPGFPSNPGTQSVVDQYAAWVNGQQAANNNSYLSNVGIAGLARDQQLRDAQANAGNDLARLAEQRYRDVDLARMGLDAQNNLAGSVWDTMNQQFGLDMDALNRQFASLDEQIQADRGYTDTLNRGIADSMGRRGQEYQRQTEYINWQKSNLDTLLGFVNQGYNQGITTLQQNYQLGRTAAGNTQQQQMAAITEELGTNNRLFTNDAAARGAVGATGTIDQFNEFQATANRKGNASRQDYELALTGLGNELQQGKAALGLQRDKGINDIDQQRAGYNYNLDQAKFGYQNDIANLQSQYDSINFQQGNRERQYQSDRGNLQYKYDSRQNQFTGDVANYNYDAANRDIASLQIDSIAREYGIREGDVGNALKSATSKIGLDYNNTMQQLASQLNSGNAQLQQQASNFLMQLMAQA